MQTEQPPQVTVQISSKKVKQLKVTFLVDNSVEWFTKLPPGFSLELTQHLTQHDPPIDDRTGVPFLDLENYCCGAHGFSALIETQVDEESEPHTILFDTGPDSKSIIRNITSMKIPVLSIERIVLSHWHADHSGGLLPFLKHRRGCEANAPGEQKATPACIVDLHPDRPTARGFAPPPKVKPICRLPEDPSFDAIESAGGKVEFHAEPHTVSDGAVYVSGEIPRVTEFERGLVGNMRWVEDNDGKGDWIEDNMIMEERYAAVDVLGKGLVIFSACSHAGIVNVVRSAIKVFNRPIHMVIGGLHLGGSDLADRIEPTISFLSNQLRPAPTYILPMHCSGFGAKVALEHAFGEGCVPCGVGMTIDLHGDEVAEKTIFPPAIA